jgi:hypothetical protein
MPQIPLYNKGLGPSVGLATDETAPKLSSQVFEAAAAAPFEGAATALGDIAKIASQFEVREQEAELAAAELDLKIKATEAASSFVYENQDSNFNTYRGNAEKFRTKWLADNVDTYEGLNKRQRGALRLAIDNAMFIDLQPGEENAFRRGQVNRAERSKTASEQLVSKLVANQGNPTMIATLQGELQDLHASAINQSLPIDWTPDSINLRVEKELLIDKSLAPETTVDDLRDERKAIIGGDGKYASYTPEERSMLAGTITESINRLQNEDVAIALSSLDDSKSAIRLARTQDDRDVALARGLQSLPALRKAGRFTDADRIEFELRGQHVASGALHSMRYSSEGDVAQLVSSYKEIAEASPTRQNEANYAAVRKLAADRRKAIDDDPAGYVAGTFIEDNGRAPTPVELVQLQQGLGVKDYKVVPFTGAQFSALQDDLKALDAPSQLDALASFFAPMDNAGLGDMAMRKAKEAGLTDVQMLAAASLDASPQIKNLARDMLNAERVFAEDPAAFNKLLSTDDKADLTAAVGTVMAEFSESVIGVVSDYGLGQQATGDRMNATTGIRNAVTKLATIYMHEDGKSADEAARIAGGIINNRYEFDKADAAGVAGDIFKPTDQMGFGVIRIPTSVLSAPEQSNYMKQIMMRYVTKPGYLLSQVATKKHRDGSDYTPAEMEKYVDEIFLGGSWVTADDDSGVYLIDRSGMPVLVKQAPGGRTGEFRLELNYQDLADMALAVSEYEIATGITGDDSPLNTMFPPAIPLLTEDMISALESMVSEVR